LGETLSRRVMKQNAKNKKVKPDKIKNKGTPRVLIATAGTTKAA
jgi:hypothetical protein